MSRCTAVVISYLCLFLKHERWQYCIEVETWLKNIYRYSIPNMKAVEKMLVMNKQFQLDEQER